jgi:hypothetical protein
MLLLHREGVKSDSVELSGFFGFRGRFLGGKIFEQHLDALFFMEVSRCYSVPT